MGVTQPAAALAFAHELAGIADGISLPRFRSGLTARTKGDGTIVTEADEAVERALRERIADTFPDHVILGEEQGGARPDDGHPCWIIDPIDGTNNYAWGVPIWATLIAHEVDGEIVAGVASAPALGERYAAARGSGATRNGDAIRVDGLEDLSRARLCYGTHGHWERFGGRGADFARLLDAVDETRSFGDFWGHMLVASGSAHLMAEPIVNVWDIAALIVIVEEAGGRLTDLAGNRAIDGGTALTSNGALHDRALAVLDGTA